MNQLRINVLLEKTLEMVSRSFHICPSHVVLKEDTVSEMLERIRGAVPEDIRDAELVLKRRDELIVEAQNRADRIIADAQNEAARILSENEIMRAVHQEGQKIREQVIQDCENIKRRAMEEADNLRVQASDEALKIRQGSENYAEQLFGRIDEELAQLQQSVRECRAYMEQRKRATYNDDMQDSGEYQEEYITD